jgi:trehalose 6-phosphate synthase
MRLSLRFIIPLLLVLAAIAYAVLPLVDKFTLTWFVRDLDIRAELVTNTLHDPLQEHIVRGSSGLTLAYFNEISNDKRLFAIGFCPEGNGPPIVTASFPKAIRCSDLARFRDPHQRVLTSVQGPLHVAVSAFDDGGEEPLGHLLLIHDMSFVEHRSEETKRYVFVFFIVLGLAISLVTVIVAQLSWRGWMQGMRAILRGEGIVRPAERMVRPELRMIERDLRDLVGDLRAGNRSPDATQVDWSPEKLREILRRELRGEEIIVVSNREPYMHMRRDDKIEVQRPASGLVTALEPIMRACSGTWIAHGSGTADRETVDAHDRVAVPQDRPAYQIRRVWLTPEEEQGYYLGFSNEGLWPLCHIAHVRPVFRASDWKAYVEVNRRFARAVADESKSANPIVLVQDYHFALLPRMIRELLPAATVITFWHIPWPNPESFAICPWRAELLDGLLGSSILGFHTQFHCNNFVDTVDRMLEARVDRETFNVTYGGAQTAVKRYPISIGWPISNDVMRMSIEDCRSSVRRRHGLPPNQKIGIGVDRLDYTKGILERFRAVERLFELQPEWIGRFTLIQVAAPSRSTLAEYQAFEVQVRATASSVNERFASSGRPAIALEIRYYDPERVYEYFRAADLCFVSSLHDGMNLVAKEFVACRDDEQGTLLLSQFTGAARELPEALIVNPYDTDECAAALHVALTMSPDEQRERMRLMRRLVREFNVYRWAGRMLIDAAGMRVRNRLTEKSQAPVTPLHKVGA